MTTLYQALNSLPSYARFAELNRSAATAAYEATHPDVSRRDCYVPSIDWVERAQQIMAPAPVQEAGYTALDEQLELLAATEAAEAEAKLSHLILRAPDADKLLEEAAAHAREYCQRVGAIDSATRHSAELGALTALVRHACWEMARLEKSLLRELQLALNETCNEYHDAGHADRLLTQYGLVHGGEVAE